MLIWFNKLDFNFFFQFQAPQSSPFKLTIAESIDRIKEEFSFLQAQYNR